MSLSSHVTKKKYVTQPYHKSVSKPQRVPVVSDRYVDALYKKQSTATNMLTTLHPTRVSILRTYSNYIDNKNA